MYKDDVVRYSPSVHYVPMKFVDAGDVILILEEPVENEGLFWGKCEWGWLPLQYTDYFGIPELPPEPEKPVTTIPPDYTYATVTNSYLNIRAGAGTNFASLGQLKKGDRVRLLEIESYNGGQWGRFEGGWIYLTSYTKVETFDEPLGGDLPQEPGSKVYGTVTYSYLNIRSGAGTGYQAVGQLNQGDRVEILEQVYVGDVMWGRIDGGWICLTDYVELETVTEGGEDITPPVDTTPPVDNNTQTKTYGTVTADVLNVRATPGGTLVGQLYRGDRVEILETQTMGEQLWGRYEGGWICLTDYVELEIVTEGGEDITPPVDTTPPVDNNTQTKTYGTVTGTDGLNVRTAPNGTICGALYRGDRVEILEIQTVGDQVWGRYEGGWFCITGYVTLETVGGNATVLAGDVTGDGVVNIKDFHRLLKHVNKTDLLTDEQLASGDVTGDGAVNIKDLQRLLKHVRKTELLPE